MITKIQENKENYYHEELFYNRARDAMFDIVNELVKNGYKDIFIPGYIGWSPKEGSGLFDPLNSITKLNRNYYKMDKNLNINLDYLKEVLSDSSILLIVNYFGFRDPNFNLIIDYAHNYNCIVIEDNAHGFFTYHLNEISKSDYTFFSLHKMFPFKEGGSLIIHNTNIPMKLSGKENTSYNPYNYHIWSILNKRLNNYIEINNLIQDYSGFMKPLKSIDLIQHNIPQTFPILLNRGDRNKVYEIMNAKGYGVVSLYHTMIDEIKDNNLFEDSVWLSERILNLPIHQDIVLEEYNNMVNCLIEAIKESENVESI